MKKKMTRIALGAAAIGIGLLIFKSWSYYQDTYAGVTAYTKIPAEVPKRVPTKDIDGKVIAGEYSYPYTFEFVTESGKTQKMTFELSGDANIQPFAPGTYAKAEISKNRITKGPYLLQEKDVSQDILEKLK